MREFYLKSLDPDEIVKISSAPKQNVKGDKAYGSNINDTIPPVQMAITSIT